MILTPTEPRPERPTVLVVDDTPTNLHILSEALRHTYDVRIATNGADALRVLRGALRPDLVLLDVMMPELDGFEVCRTISSDASLRDIPVIFLTARDAPSDQLHGLQLGAVDYVTKPFDVPVLLARVQAQLRLKQRSDQLEASAARDGLTGLFNRRRLEEHLEAEWQRCLRSPGPLSVLMADIDAFKGFNDAFGHVRGDACLRSVAKALAEAVTRRTDLLARYGGEEFTAVLAHTDSQGAGAVAERMRLNVSGLAIPHPCSPAGPMVTVSVGYATTIPKRERSWIHLVESADRALYAAKTLGRDRSSAETFDSG